MALVPTLLNSALKALGGSLAGLVTGNNPLSQAQIGTFVGANLPATPLVSTRSYFSQALNTWIASPVLQSQWIMVIDTFPPALASSIIRNLERTGGNSRAYDIDLAKAVLASLFFQKVIGCLFCKRFEMPEEVYTVINAPITNNRGFIPGVISGERSGYAEKQLSIDFYDNNYSFVENIIRPWTILASHFGHVTRKESIYSVKTNISVLCFSKTLNDVSMTPSRVYRFFNCVPTQVASKALEYDEPNSTGTSSAKFSFTNYTVETGLFLPVSKYIYEKFTR